MKGGAPGYKGPMNGIHVGVWRVGGEGGGG